MRGFCFTVGFRLNDKFVVLNNLQPYKTERQYPKTQERDKQKEPAAVNKLLPVFGFDSWTLRFIMRQTASAADKNVW